MWASSSGVWLILKVLLGIWLRGCDGSLEPSRVRFWVGLLFFLQACPKQPSLEPSSALRKWRSTGRWSGVCAPIENEGERSRWKLSFEWLWRRLKWCIFSNYAIASMLQLWVLGCIRPVSAKAARVMTFVPRMKRIGLHGIIVKAQCPTIGVVPTEQTDPCRNTTNLKVVMFFSRFQLSLLVWEGSLNVPRAELLGADESQTQTIICCQLSVLSCVFEVSLLCVMLCLY